MGTSNASTVAQNHYTRALNQHLTGNLEDDTPIADRVFNFQDDFLLAANTLEEMNVILRAFMNMCRKADIQMNPAKTHLTTGEKGAQFYGFRVSGKGISPAEKNLDPVRKMTAPKDVSGVRAVLGVFNQFRSFIQRYDRLAGPIQKLVKKNVRFVWNDEAQKAMERIRDILLKKEVYLRVQDPKVQLQLETDGSDDGWGAILYQEIEGERRVICMWSKQWRETMRRMPAYYRETKAWMLGVEKSRIYADFNHLPLLCWTDHIPLTYLKHTSGKGPVSQFHLDHLSDIEYEIRYRKGTEITADHVSRFPMLGPKRIGKGGKIKAVNTLLDYLPKGFQPQGKVWIYAGKESGEATDLVNKWRRDNAGAKTKILVSHSNKPSRRNIAGKKYSFAIWAPPAERISHIVKEALLRDIPFACLIPSCLVHRLGLSKGERQKWSNAAKLALLDPELTWVVHGVEGMSHKVMAIWGVQTFLKQMPNTAEEIGRKGPAEWNDEEFLAEQKEAVQLYDPDKVITRKDGFAMYSPDGQDHLVIIPQKRAKELVEWQHRRMCHAGQAKVYSELARHFHWPNMRKQIREWVTKCANCQLLKAKRKHAHNHFRANPQHKPRTAYGMDFYSVGQSVQGYKHILGIIDLATSELELIPTKDRKAATVTECLMTRIFLNKGCPAYIHSDHAKEFVAKATKRICRVLGCRRTTTLAHHPTGNATIERAWQYVTLVLRSCNKEQYARWDAYVQLWQHTWNTTPHTLLEITPFEAAHGLPAVSATEVLARTPTERVEAMSRDSVTALQAAAKANLQVIKQLRTHDKQMRARKANNTRATQSFKLGDKVVFYIPPTEPMSKKKSNRKNKHILQYRGPGIITRVRTPTTYDLTYKGKQYSRATSELRPYRAEEAPRVEFPDDMAAEEQIKPGSIVAYLEEEGDAYFHIGKVKSMGDTMKIIAHATTGKRLAVAIWKPLQQIVKTEQYTLTSNGRRVQVPVYDDIPNDAIETLIVAKELKIDTKGRLCPMSRTTLQLKGKNHHQLGKTFP